jgi:uncharacterized protein YbjQ (UPF0145 family)
MKYDNCPNCGEEIKSSVFKSNLIVTGDRVKLADFYSEEKVEALCDTCFSDNWSEARDKLINELKSLKSELWSDRKCVIASSIMSPLNWDYRVIGMTSSQSALGTGPLTELSATWSDLIGGENKSIGNKISMGEANCLMKLRNNALEMGGNAILGVDIDYSEVGGQRGMLLVCMTGTVVILNNPEVLGNKVKEGLDRIAKNYSRFKEVKSFEKLVIE